MVIMKKPLTLLMVVLSSFSLINVTKSSLAQTNPSKNIYKCIQNKGTPTTVVETPRGRIELITWKSEAFGEKWDPQTRCQTVTKRFQDFSDQGSLRYVTTGILNNQKVICVAEKVRGDYECLSNGLLITLEPNDNPQQIIKEIFSTAAKVGGIPTTRGTVVFPIESYLEDAPLMEDSTE
jgi:hypothetical protein